MSNSKISVFVIQEFSEKYASKNIYISELHKLS